MFSTQRFLFTVVLDVIVRGARLSDIKVHRCAKGARIFWTLWFLGKTFGAEEARSARIFNFLCGPLRSERLSGKKVSVRKAAIHYYDRIRNAAAT